ncbi:MAG: DUF4124 domain-containing protein [Gammaproteobacteria bacterium]|nr:MAG: DUF4124 domain-containing protein [Gammaproteobacteria bacterium]
MLTLKPPIPGAFVVAAKAIGYSVAMKKILLTLCLALASGAVQAQKVFRVVQPDGTVLFTDVPPPDRPATQIEVPPLNTTAPLAPPAKSVPRSVASEQEGYDEFRISRPGDGETIRDNGGNVNVDLSLKPRLRAGHKIDLLLDGRSIGGGKATAITLTDMDRGAHSLQAVVKDAAGQVVARSKSITFTLQRRSVILQPGPPRAVPFGGGGGG